MPEHIAIDRYVQRNKASEKLYALEGLRDKVIDDCVVEYQKLFPEIDIVLEARPSQLLNILESFDISASRAAAKAFLERHPE